MPIDSADAGSICDADRHGPTQWFDSGSIRGTARKGRAERRSGSTSDHASEGDEDASKSLDLVRIVNFLTIGRLGPVEHEFNLNKLAMLIALQEEHGHQVAVDGNAMVREAELERPVEATGNELGIGAKAETARGDSTAVASGSVGVFEIAGQDSRIDAAGQYVRVRSRRPQIGEDGAEGQCTKLEAFLLKGVVEIRHLDNGRRVEKPARYFRSSRESSREELEMMRSITSARLLVWPS